MSLLSEYPLEFEDMPLRKNPIRVGRTFTKMSKKTSTQEAPKVYSKTRGEHFKDMVIVALVVGIVAFGLGFKFNADRNAEMQSAVKAAQTATVVAQPEVKK